MSEQLYINKNSQYLSNHPNWHVEDSKWKAEKVLDLLFKQTLNPKTIAEVGCGAGEILNQLYHELPGLVEFTGYDISKDAINMANTRKKGRLRFKHQNILETDEKYDLLLMMDVFEHIEDYLGFLKTCKPKAKYTIFHIPLDISVEGILRNRLIFGRKRGGHLHYFEKNTALATLEDAGYTIIDTSYTAGMLELPLKSIKSRLAYFPRKLTYRINKDLAARVFGGFSLLVLAK